MNKVIRFEVYKENTFKCYKGKEHDFFILHYKENSFVIEEKEKNVKGQRMTLGKNIELSIIHDNDSNKTFARIEIISDYYDNIYFNSIQPKDIAVFTG